MTLAIAWRKPEGGLVLAADRKVTGPDHGVYYGKKIHENWGMTWAFAGDTEVEHFLRHTPFTIREDGQSVEQWWALCVAPALYTFAKENESSYQVLVTDGKDVYVSSGQYLQERKDAFSAIGSSAAFAYGFFESAYTAGPYWVYTMFIRAAVYDESVSEGINIVEFPAKKKRGKK